MNLLETIERVFDKDNVMEVSNKLGEIGDLLEYGKWSKDEIISSVDCLLNHISESEEDSVIENILNISLNVMNVHSVFDGFDLDSVISCMEKLNTECISYVLTFIGFTGNREYRSILQSYLENDKLKEEAEEALFELDYRINKT